MNSAVSCGSTAFAAEQLSTKRRMTKQAIALLALFALAPAVSGCGGDGGNTTGGVELVTDDLVPNPLYEDDPGFSFNIYFSGDVKPAAGGLSLDVVDDLGVVYKKLDKSIVAQPKDQFAMVNVLMPHVLPDLPAPGNVTIRLWDGDSYDTSDVRDEATVALVARDPIESAGTAGGGLLQKGVQTTIWGVLPYIDPSDPGLEYEGSLDIWTMKDAAAGDTVLVEFGGWNGAKALDDQFANVYLRSATSGEFVAQVVKRVPGMGATVQVPKGGAYFLYVQHNPAEWADTAEYRVHWK